MGKLLILFAAFGTLVSTCFGSDIPVISPSDFSGSEASYLWHVIAGTGILGAIVTAVVKIVLVYVQPLIDTWVAKHRVQLLYDIIYDGVKGCYELYTKEYKAANADGKLTTDEIAYIRNECQEYIKSHLTHAGVDLLKEFGPRGIDRLCEMMLARIKSEELKAALAPLPGSESPPLPA